MKTDFTSSSRPAERRLMQLDVLRGVAILLVLGRHRVLSPKEAGLFLPLAGVWERFGWTGVDLFFVLSGFLIGGLLFHEFRSHSRIDLKRFFVRRTMKIWPLYYLYLVMLFVVMSVEEPGVHIKEHLLSLVPSLLNVQNYFGMPRTHLWSLAVEEHFYLILPFFLLLFLRKRKGLVSLASLPYALLGSIALCTILRCFANWHKPFTFERNLYPTHLRFDGLLWGVLLAYLYHWQPDVCARIARHRLSLIVVGLVLICPMAVFKLETTPFVSMWGYTLLSLGYGCILLAFIHTQVGTGRLGKWLGSKPVAAIAFLGTFSYPIYLWHEDVALNPVVSLLHHGWLAGCSPSVRWLVATGVYVLIAVGCGALIGACLEKPLLILRNKLFPAKASALNTEPTAPREIAVPTVLRPVTAETLTAGSWVTLKEANQANSVVAPPVSRGPANEQTWADTTL